MTNTLNPTWLIIGPHGSYGRRKTQDFCKTHNIPRDNQHVLTCPDKKTTIPIENLRNACASLRLTSDGRRALIIEEADTALSHTAWQTLLKIAEEPPKDAHLLLRVSDMNRLPATLQSRAQLWSIPLCTTEEANALFPQGTSPKAKAFALAMGKRNPDVITPLLPYLSNLETLSTFFHAKGTHKTALTNLNASSLPFSVMMHAALCWHSVHKKPLPKDLLTLQHDAARWALPETLIKDRFLHSFTA